MKRGLLLLLIGVLVFPSVSLAQKMTQEEKDAYNRASAEWNVRAACWGTAAGIMAISSVGGGPAAPLIAAGSAVTAIVSGVSWIVSAVESKWALDPADSNFRVLATPRERTFNIYTVRLVTNAQVTTALNAVLTNASRMTAVSDAMIISINRAQGAALAKDAAWQQRQAQATKEYALQLASIVQEQPRFYFELHDSLVGANIRFAPSSPDIEKIKRTVAERGFPPELIWIYTEMGLSGKDIQDLRKRVVQTSAGLAAYNIPDAFDDPQIATSSNAVAAALRNFAASITVE